MSPRPDVSHERRGQILAAAISVFAKLGLDQARIDDIVAEAGLSKGALYWYFKSKDEIVAAVLDLLFARELTQLESLLVVDEPAYQRLLTFARHTAAEFKAMPHMAPILYEFYARAFRHPAVRQALQRDFRRYLKLAAPLIQQGIDRGEFRPIHADRGANALAAIIEGTLLLWVFDPAAIELEAQIEMATRIFLDGLRLPGSIHPATPVGRAGE